MLTQSNILLLNLEETDNVIETYTRDIGTRITNLVDIFEETTNFNDRTFLLNLPKETINTINDSTSLLKNQPLTAALADLLSDSMKIGFLVRSIQYNEEDTLEFPEKRVKLRGATNDRSKLTFWYEITPKDKNSNKIFSRESLSTPDNLNWIYNKAIKKQTNETNVELEDINAIAVDFPDYNEDGTLYFPFYLLMMLRSFLNNGEYFHTKNPGYWISLNFIVPQNFQSMDSFKEQAVAVITNLIKDIRKKDMESSGGQFRRPIRKRGSDYSFIIEPSKKTLFMLGITPGSFDDLSRYISDAKVLDPNIFDIQLVSTIPNQTNMFSLPR